jgi:hypothetical protein
MAEAPPGVWALCKEIASFGSGLLVAAREKIPSEW